MQPIERAASIAIGRGCGFTGLGILCVMLGLSFDPALAARTGGVLFVCLAIYLWGMSYTSMARSYERTETWSLLKDEYRPPQAVAQRMISQALRNTQLYFSVQASGIGVILLFGALMLDLAAATKAAAF